MKAIFTNEPLVVSSPAKVNLYLRVGGRRADGFHPLTSWFCTIGLADELVFTPTADLAISLTCDNPGVPCDGRNLIIRAAEHLRPYATQITGIQIELRKRVPMGGGLGGGSSNAAATLIALAGLWRCSLSPDRLHDIAAELGSDVPFFLHGPSAICRGRGELVSSITVPKPQAALIVLPGIEMPTPAVYRKFDEMKLGTDLEQVEGELPSAGLDTGELLARLVNDLETPAFAISPDLARLRGELEDRLGRPVRMSGSGSTLFTLYVREEEAREAAASIGDLARALACKLGE